MTVLMTHRANFQAYDTDRAALAAALQSSGLPVWLCDETTEKTARDLHAKVAGRFERKFLPLPFSRHEYPALFAPMPSGTAIVTPFNGGAFGGWVTTLIVEMRNPAGGATMTLARNSETVCGLQYVFHQSELAVLCAALHGRDGFDPVTEDGMYWRFGDPVYRQVPQIQKKDYKKAAA
jgi:hypothetical protein